MELGGDLEAVEASGFAFLSDLCLDQVPGLLVLEDLLVVSSYLVVCCPFVKNGLVWHNDSDQIALKGVAVDEDLGDVEGLSDLALDLVGDYVFALGQFKDVLLSVDDLECSIGCELADVTGVNPAVLIDCLLGKFGLLVVSLEAVVAAVADLTSGHWVSAFILIIACVVHVGDIH